MATQTIELTSENLEKLFNECDHPPEVELYDFGAGNFIIPVSNSEEKTVIKESMIVLQNVSSLPYRFNVIKVSRFDGDEAGSINREELKQEFMKAITEFSDGGK